MLEYGNVEVCSEFLIIQLAVSIDVVFSDNGFCFAQ